MAKKGTMKDIEDSVSDAIDNDGSSKGPFKAKLAPTTREGYNDAMPESYDKYGVDDQMNHIQGRDNEDDGGSDDDEGVGKYAYANGMPQSGNTSGNGPIGDAIQHIQSGRATPEEMIMLHKALGR